MTRVTLTLRLLPLATIVACVGADPSPCEPDAPGAPWLAFSTSRDGSYDVAIVRLDGSCERVLGSAPSSDLFPTWVSRSVVVFASDRGGALGLWLHDLASGDERPIDVGPLTATYPAASPDGSLLAFEGSSDGATGSAILVVATSGGTPVRLTDDSSVNGAPAWSPDGATVYFVSNRTGAWEIFSVPAAGGASAQVTTGSRIVGRPAVSGDGAAVIWARTATGGTELVRRAVAGGAITVLAPPGDSEPATRPGTDELVARTYRYGATELVSIDPSGVAPPARVTRDRAACGAPAFAP